MNGIPSNRLPAAHTKFDACARDRILAYPWADNVRELSIPADVLVFINQLDREDIERVLVIAGSHGAAARILDINLVTLYPKRQQWERAFHA